MNRMISVEVVACLKEYCEENQRKNKGVKKLARDMVQTGSPFGIYWGNRIMKALNPQSLTATTKRDEK